MKKAHSPATLSSSTDTERLLAQAVFPRLNCDEYRGGRKYRDATRRLAEERGVGGFVLFNGSVDDAQYAVDDLQKRTGNVLLFAADCEYGLPMRFTGGTEFPHAMALGSAGDVSVTYAVARSIASEMRALGIYWNFAPVADINNNPKNPIINIRSFGEEAEIVASHVHAYVRGLQDEGIAACAKHFPGHGNTDTDSHSELPTLRYSKERLLATELIPFKRAIREEVQSVMVAHIAAPKLDASGVPATLSSEIINGLLRTEMGFTGVVVTDALEMHSISKHYGDGEAAVKAYLAGNDVLETMPDPEAALQGLFAAAREGVISEEVIAASSARVEALKKWCARAKERRTTLERAKQGHDVIALEAARRSFKTTGGIRRFFSPLYVLAFVTDPESQKPGEWFTYFSSWYTGEASGAIVTPEVSEEDKKDMLDCVAKSGSVVIALFVRPMAYSNGIGLSEDQEEILREALKKQCTLLNFGNPYLLRDTEPAFRLDAYSGSSATLAASIEVLGKMVK